MKIRESNNFPYEAIKDSFRAHSLALKGISKDVLSIFREPPYPLVLTDTEVGVEVELEKFNYDNYLRAAAHIPIDLRFFWDMKEDRSLRNNGMEFVSTAMRGDSILYSLNLLETVLKGTKVEFNARTGTHVHLNVRELTPYQISCLFFLYILYEESFFRFSGQREKNIFCIPSNIMETRIFDILKQPKDDNLFYRTMLSLRDNKDKYSGLNFRPINSFGTLEFRHMVGTYDRDYLWNWINMILSLHKYCRDVDFNLLKEEVFSLNSNSEYERFSQKVFGNDVCNVLLNSNIKSEMELGVCKLKELQVQLDLTYIDDQPKTKKNYQENILNGDNVKILVDNNMILDQMNIIRQGIWNRPLEQVAQIAVEPQVDPDDELLFNQER